VDREGKRDGLGVLLVRGVGLVVGNWEKDKAS